MVLPLDVYHWNFRYLQMEFVQKPLHSANFQQTVAWIKKGLHNDILYIKSDPKPTLADSIRSPFRRPSTHSKIVNQNSGSLDMQRSHAYFQTPQNDKPFDYSPFAYLRPQEVVQSLPNVFHRQSLAYNRLRQSLAVLLWTVQPNGLGVISLVTASDIADVAVDPLRISYRALKRLSIFSIPHGLHGFREYNFTKFKALRAVTLTMFLG